MNGTDAETGKPFTRAGIQILRIANGRLVETWVAIAGEGAGHALGQLQSEVPGDRVAGTQYVWGD